MRKAACLFFLFTTPLLLACSSRIDPQKRGQSRHHYRQGLELYRQGEVESAVWELEQAVQLDDCYAAAYDLLGQIYLRRGDIRGRWRATKRALRAVSLDPEEPDYRYNLAVIYRERGFGYNAKREFRKVMEMDSTYWRAQYQVGLLEEESALKYESQERHREAVEAFGLVARMAPEEHDVLYHLGLNLGELGLWDEAVERLLRAVDSQPERPEARLLLGVAYQMIGRLEKAESSYVAAVERMDHDDREPFESLKFLAPEEDLEGYRGAEDEEFLRVFWKQRDPTPTTRINERRLEHYRRVAHANIHFAAPKLDLPGWKTKRGEFYIRYGEPKVKWRELGEVSSGVGLVPPRWVWLYGQEGREVSLIFADTFLNGEYNFPFPDKTWGPSNFRNSPATVAQRMVTSQPADYWHDYGAELLEFVYRTVEFRGAGESTDLQVVYGIPNQNLEFSRVGQMARATIERCAVLFDLGWQEVVRAEDQQSFQIPPTQVSNPYLMAVEKADFQVPGREYWLALNVRDKASGNLGIVKKRLKVRNFPGDSLAISSLVLANELYSSEGADRFQRGDLVVVPRLGRLFPAAQPLLVYYEVYHLTKDKWSETWYQTEYAIVRRPGKKNLLSKALSVLTAPFGAGDKWESVSSTTEYRGTSEMEVGQLQVDMSGAAPGKYDLILTVTDMNSGQRVEGEVGFWVVE